MTNDLDAILSAYIDGQATPDEVALVEGDRDLLARAEGLRATAAQLGQTPKPPAAVRSAHLAAALDAFDVRADSVGGVAAATGPAASEPVVDLASRRGRRTPRSAKGEAETSRSGLPSWLGAAAALLLVVGGIGWVASRSGGNDDDTASVAVTESAETQADAAIAPAAEDDATESADSDASASGAAGELAQEEAAEDEAMEDDEAAEDAERLTAADNGFFDDQTRDEARVEFETLPDEAQQEALAEGPTLDPELSLCSALVAEINAFRSVAFVPITVAGVDGEFLIFTDPADGATALRVVDEECTLLG